jgi:hypothetical protein
VRWVFKADVGSKGIWGTALAGYPLAGVVHFGNTTFLGDNRDALGFSTLWSVGYALQLDVSRLEIVRLDPIVIGLKYGNLLHR